MQAPNFKHLDEAERIFKNMQNRRYRIISTENGVRHFSYEICPKGHGCDKCMKKYTDSDVVVSGTRLLNLQEKMREVNEDLEHIFSFSVLDYTRCFSICMKCFREGKEWLEEKETRLSRTSKHYKKYAPKIKGYGQLPLEKSVHF